MHAGRPIAGGGNYSSSARWLLGSVQFCSLCLCSGFSLCSVYWWKQTPSWIITGQTGQHTTLAVFTWTQWIQADLIVTVSFFYTPHFILQASTNVLQDKSKTSVYVRGSTVHIKAKASKKFCSDREGRFRTTVIPNRVHVNTFSDCDFQISCRWVTEDTPLFLSVHPTLVEKSHGWEKLSLSCVCCLDKSTTPAVVLGESDSPACVKMLLFWIFDFALDSDLSILQILNLIKKFCTCKTYIDTDRTRAL